MGGVALRSNGCKNSKAQLNELEQCPEYKNHQNLFNVI